MARYILKRVLQMIPVFIGATVLMFLVTTVVPGDPVALITGEKSMTPSAYKAIVKAHHLDQPIWRQYLYYMDGLLHGDLGHSYQRGREVKDILAEKYPYTIRLALAAILIEIIFGIAVGIISAVKRYSWMDVTATLATSILVSMPVFWLGMLLQTFFGILLKKWTGATLYMPISGASSDAFPEWVHLILPALTLASVSTAYAARIMRSQLLEVQGQDYIRTAEAKGLTQSAVIWRHAMKNALIPVVTFIAIDLGAMLSGAILTETVFNWPGIGYEIFRAVGRRDWPVVTGGVIVVVVVIMLINLLVDISYAFLDPRIRYGGVSEKS
jgi:ABC-type dipeptide/oligopeptide/nickel transport system permease component